MDARELERRIIEQWNNIEGSINSFSFTIDQLERIQALLGEIEEITNE